jgi:membrane protease YdiL (CAAX protease family)
MRRREDSDGRISGPTLLALHLAPGVLFALFFFILSRILIRSGYTAYLALIISIPVFLVPMEIGVMLWWKRRFARSGSSEEVIVYRRTGTVADYVLFPALLFLCVLVLSFAFGRISEYLGTVLPPWLPGWATQEALVDGLRHCPPGQQSVALLLAIPFSGFAAPIVEELYFRGFLLPRMEHLRWAAPVMSSLLFALYHFYFPGNVLLVFLCFLPISYVVRSRRNVTISIITHSVINLWGVAQLYLILT